MKKKLLVPLILFLLTIIAFLVPLKREAQGEDTKKLESALIGKPMPVNNFTELFENKAYTNELFQQGKPVLLNVWATWCPTCYAEHQYLNKLAKDGVRIIGLDYKDESPKAMKWLKDLGNPYQVVLKDEKGSFGFDLGVYGAPETFIVDGKGGIHYRYAGDVNEKVWTQILKPIYDKLSEQQ